MFLSHGFLHELSTKVQLSQVDKLMDSECIGDQGSHLWLRAALDEGVRSSGLVAEVDLPKAVPLNIQRYDKGLKYLDQ